MKIKILPVFLFCVSISFAADNFKPLDSFLTTFEKLGFPSTVLIAKKNEIIFSKSYGVKEGSAYYIASLSKLFTAAAIYKLEGKGLLNVNDSLPVFFNNVPVDKSGITIKHLITHQSGLQSTSYTHLVEGIFDKDEALKALLDSKLLFPPGTDEEYSSDGYSLLAIIIEKVTGETFEEYMRSEIFSVLKLNSTGFVGDSLKWAEGETADMKYGLSDYKGSPQYLKRDWSNKGGAGMISTADDIFTFVKSEMPVYDFFWSEMTNASGEELLYSSGDDDAIGHNVVLVKYIASDITVIIMTNAGLISNVSACDIIATKVDEALAEMLVTGKLDSNVRPDSLSKDLVGNYASDSENGFEILNSSNRILLSGRGQEMINAISGTNTAIFEELNIKASEIIEALKKNDSVEVSRLIVKQKIAKQLMNLWRGLLKKYGLPLEVTAIGTSKVWWYPSGSCATWVEFRFKSETRLYRMEWDRSGNLKQLGGSAIKNPLTCIVGQNSNGKIIAMDIGNNVLLELKKSGKMVKIKGDEEMEFTKTK